MRAGFLNQQFEFARDAGLHAATSVTMALRFKAGSISRTRERICASGVHRMTRSASQTAASKSVVAKIHRAAFHNLSGWRYGGRSPQSGAQVSGV